MGICATSSGNLIVIWHFACLIFTHLWVFVYICMFYVTASSKMMPQILHVVPSVALQLCSGHPDDIIDLVPCSCLVVCLEAVCTHLPAYNVNFLACTLNKCFLFCLV